MEETLETYNGILSVLRRYDLDHKQEHLKKRSQSIINNYSVSQEYIQKMLESSFKQKKVQNINDLIIKQKIELEEIVEDIENPLLLGITGVGNSGKSSFINSILNDQITKVNKRAETWLIEIINYIEKDYKNGDGIVHFDGKKGVYKKKNEIQEIFNKENAKFNTSLDKVYEEVKKLNELSISLDEKLEREEEIEKKYTYRSKLHKLKRFYDNELLRKFRFADTPGLGQNNKSQLKDVLDYYKIADGLVFIVDADSVSNCGSTKESLIKIRKNSSINTKILLIINKVDDSKAFYQIKKSAEKNYGMLVDYILPYSAIHVINGHKEGNEEKLKEYNYYEAQQLLNKVYISNKLVRLDKKNESFNIILKTSRERILKMTDDIESKCIEYDENILELKNRLKTLINSSINNYISNVRKVNNILDLLVEKKVNGTIDDYTFSRKTSSMIEMLNSENTKELNKSNALIKKEMKRIINDSFVSDYKWLKNSNHISDDFFDSFEQEISDIKVETYRKGLFTKTIEKAGDVISDTFYRFDKISAYGNKLSNTSTTKKKNIIHSEKQRINEKLRDIENQIKEKIRRISREFELKIIKEITDDFNNAYIEKKRLKQLKVIINSLSKNLKLDIVPLNIVKILKKENII